MSKTQVSKRQNSLVWVKADEDDDEDSPTNEFISYANSQMTFSKLVVYLDEPIQSAKYYRPLIEHMSLLGENDYVLFRLNNPGGIIDGAIALINAIHETDAQVECRIDGTCSSAASLIALSAPVVSVSPHSHMMFHSAAFGSRGKQENVETHVNFLSPKIRNLMKDIYKDFLSTDELADLNKGIEIWLDTAEIESRLQQREILQKKALEAEAKAATKEEKKKASKKE